LWEDYAVKPKEQPMPKRPDTLETVQIALELLRRIPRGGRMVWLAARTRSAVRWRVRNADTAAKGICHIFAVPAGRVTFIRNGG